MRTAIITGITGQDGSYLSKYLINLDYKVIGITRSYSGAKIHNLKYLGISDKIELVECDMYDLASVINLIKKYEPDHFYNLAAQSSVGVSFEQPISTIKYNIESVINILEAIRLVNNKIKFYQASSSEMYGSVTQLPVTLQTVLNPVSPYAISKATSYWLVDMYRNAYGLFAVNGVLFNHESVLRTNNFFVKKIISESIEVMNGKREYIKVGNIEIKRDFGYSPEYVKAMYLALSHSCPNNYIVCSGKSIALKDIVLYVFQRLNISESKLIIDDTLFRPAEIADLYGDNSLTKMELGWEYDLDFFDVLDIIISEELKNMGDI